MIKKIALPIAIAALAITLMACISVKPAAPEVKGIALAKELTADYKPVKETTEFYPNEPFYCSVNVANIRKGDAVKASWFYGEELLNETTYTAEKSGSGYIGFKLEPEKYWPIGQYRVEISLNDQAAGEKTFSVVPPKEAIPSKVKKVVTAKEVDENQKPVELAIVFAPDETVHCSVNADLGIYSRLVAKWYHEGKLLEDFTTTFIAEKNAPDTYVDFYLEPSRPLPEGNYTVEIYLDGNLARTVDFSVSKETATANMKLYSNDAFGFSILYPSDWEVLETEESVQFRGSPAAMLAVGVIENPEGAPQEIAEGVINSLKEDYPTLEVSYSGTFSANEIEWWEVDLTFEEEGKKNSSILLFTVKGDKAYAIITVAPTEEEDHWLSYFVEMVNSFKIK